MEDCLTASMFCGDRTASALTGVFFFNAEALALKSSTHNCTVLAGNFSVTSNIEMFAKYSLRFNNRFNIFKKRFNNERTILRALLLHGYCNGVSYCQLG
jgi:hypothetical protein